MAGDSNKNSSHAELVEASGRADPENFPRARGEPVEPYEHILV